MDGVAHLILAAWAVSAAPQAGAVPPFHERVTVAAPQLELPLFEGLASASLEPSDFAVLGPDPARHLQVARRAAGAFVGQVRQRLDGLPAGLVPATQARGAVALESDPFAVENGGLDQIDVAIGFLPATGRWQAGGSPGALIWSGGEPLAPGTRARVKSASAFLAGPVPGTGITIFMQAGRYADARAVPFVDAALASLRTDLEDGVTSSRQSSRGAGLAWVRGGADVRVAWLDARTRILNGGIGGTIDPAAGFDLDMDATRLQGSWQVTRRRFIAKGGLSLERDGFRSGATSTGAGVVVPGLAIAGGNEITRRRHARGVWTFSNVVESRTRRWLAGVEASHASVEDERVFNPGGVAFSNGSRPPTFFTFTGGGVARVHARSGALFGQHIAIAGRAFALRLGLRADWREHEGVFVSPRLALGALVRGTTLYAGAGLMAEEWPVDSGLETAWRGPLGGFEIGGRPVSLVVADRFRRRRDIVIRAGASRGVGPVVAGVEQKWTRGIGLAGSTRIGGVEAIVDSLDADRRLARSQTHLMARRAFRRGWLAAHYEFVSSFDDTDGWFSLPAGQKGSAAEWARSSGVAQHYGSLVASVTLPGAVAVMLSAQTHAGMPFNVTTSLDPEGLGTFTDRGGRPRNAGRRPRSSDVSLYLSRTFQLPKLRGVAIDTGLRLENMFDRLNVLDVGGVAGSALFERPLAADAGRRVGVWMTLARR